LAGLASLSDAEIALIKGMAQVRPRLSYQAILSYFTRPGRDINHRLIPLIVGGWLRSEVATAPPGAVIAFMSALTSVRYPVATFFHNVGKATAMASPFVALLELNWWPVGQGLFMSGRLESAQGGDFTWVYDCGSISEKTIRDKAIGQYNKTTARQIDLVTLSHFDEDHINGIVELIRGRTIGTVLLPFIPLWQRLLIALGEGIPVNSALFEFFVDPVAYLASVEGTEIGEIVFVPSAGPDDAAAPAPEEGDPDGPIEGAKIDYGKPPEDSAENLELTADRSVRAGHLRPGGRIAIPSLWEFVPYNDAQMQPRVTPSFTRRANIVASALIRTPKRRYKALKLLKKIYIRTFGKGSKPQNLISLFLYSGPVGSRLKLAHDSATSRVTWSAARDNYAQLFTGDGYLHTPAQLQALQHFYAKDRRLARAGILQVMHHGASANWHNGVASTLAPAVSIFSSDPARKPHHHPNADVLRDFWPWCPVQVDRSNGFHLLAVIEKS